MSDVSAPGLSQLVQRVQRALRERATQKTREIGVSGMRPAHAALLPHIPPDGVRVGALATRAGLTKQATSQLLDELAREGLVAQSPDPTDRRAALVRFTKRGQEAMREGLDVNAALDAELSAALGVERVERMRQDLSELLAAIDRC